MYVRQKLYQKIKSYINKSKVRSKNWWLEISVFQPLTRLKLILNWAMLEFHAIQILSQFGVSGGVPLNRIFILSFIEIKLRLKMSMSIILTLFVPTLLDSSCVPGGGQPAHL